VPEAVSYYGRQEGGKTAENDVNCPPGPQNVCQEAAQEKAHDCLRKDNRQQGKALGHPDLDRPETDGGKQKGDGHI